MAKTKIEVVAQILDCEACELVDGCTSPVPFAGEAPNAIMVLGEAPGEKEDLAGRPFVGPAGELLTSTMEGKGLDPETVSFVNVVSCWPKGTPTATHLDACRHNLQDQVELIDPRWVLVVGRTAIRTVARWVSPAAYGKPFEIGGRVHLATYHPSAVLRDPELERAFRRHIETFAAMVDSGEWLSWVKDECSECPLPGVWLDDTGLQWCEAHMPQHVRVVYQRRMQRLENELQAARERKDARQAAERKVS